MEDNSFSDEVEICEEKDQKKENLQKNVVRNHRTLFEHNIESEPTQLEPELESKAPLQKRAPQAYSFKSVKCWCFVCEKQFQKLRTDLEGEVLCPECSNITEIIEEGESHPREFRIQQQNQP